MINQWGPDFRTAFKQIGTFLRGRLPSGTPIVALSATVQPGPATTSIFSTLGFFSGSFTLIRRSNERPNIHFGIQKLTHGLNGSSFPDLLPLLASGRKALIHSQSIETIFQCFLYLCRCYTGADPLRAIRMYHALLPAAYNIETLALLESDPLLQVVIGTIAAANGLNVRTLLDSFALEMSKTLDMALQQAGRAGRVESVLSRAMVLVSQATITAAEKQLGSTYNLITNYSVAYYCAAYVPKRTSKKRPTKPAKVETMEPARAQILAEKS
jgi:superfamily II DNA helicase RecQ